MKTSFVTVLTLCLAVAACGGGGGSSGSPRTLGSVPRLPNLPDRPIVSSPSLTNPTVTQLEGYYQTYLSRSLAAVEFDLVKLDRGYANIYRTQGVNAATRPGNGVTIGVVDGGFDKDHPAFEGKRITVEYFGNATANSDLESLDSSSDGGSHGTSVASIAAGVRQDWSLLATPVTSEGVAPGADMRWFAYDGTATTFDALYDSIEEAIIAALNPARNVDILNISLGLSAEDGIITDSLYADAGLSASDFPEAIQAGRAEKTIFVWAAGNENGDPCTPLTGIESCSGGKVDASSPSPLAGLMYLIPELRPHSVAVVAVKPDGTIADFSNRCGVAASWCIAAPGEGIGVAYSERNLVDGSILRSVAVNSEDFTDGRGNGTSFAAPIVSGALALMKQQFRGQLSNVQLLARMFATADKTGVYANASTYGQGLLDIGAATEPVGKVMMASGGGEFLDSEDGWRFSSLQDTRFQTGEAFGDGLSRSLAGREIAAFDSLGAPFWYPLESFAVKTENPVVRRQLISFMDFSAGKTGESEGASVIGGRGKTTAPLFAERRWGGDVPEGEEMQAAIYVEMARGQMETPGRFGGLGHLAFVDNPVYFGMKSGNFAASAFTSDETGERPAKGAVASYNLPNLPLSFLSGYISESKSALGAISEGAFGDLSASTVFASIGYDYDFGNWQIVADAEVGVTYSEAESGLIGDVSQLKTSSFSAGLTRNLSGGSAIRVFVSSPVRIEGGKWIFPFPQAERPKAGY